MTASRMRGASASLSNMTVHICRHTSKISCPSDTRTIAVVSEMSSSDVSVRKLTVERNDRFEDYTTSTYEV